MIICFVFQTFPGFYQKTKVTQSDCWPMPQEGTSVALLADFEPAKNGLKSPSASQCTVLPPKHTAPGREIHEGQKEQTGLNWPSSWVFK